MFDNFGWVVYEVVLLLPGQQCWVSFQRLSPSTGRSENVACKKRLCAMISIGKRL
jgi:hypothetical protein